MAWDWTQIQTLASADAAIQAITDGSTFIEAAEVEISEAIWKDRYNIGRAYLALHYASISPGDHMIAPGPETGHTIEGISRNYTPKSPSTSSPWDFTPYGRKYRELARIVGRTQVKF